ncbi:ArsC/Spx/MgsR family protein [Solimicrobium silvestre]|uniref:Arsenate reductase and related proteins glutaredoxin family n=1 Tax=Solimicrobium silvestre TaxID=2099400 RepID=A0A2S9H4B4_9BURK|nr:ArsC/Spx/MgsR family protein [Solimicrobium silvestre]PRC94763.1 Arsenate reductase and related proteins glutaredoxin family [Solimicrobium silvestre]
MITIYHNPRCSKSRAALELTQQFAEQNQLALSVIEYLKTLLNLDELRALQKQLGEQSRDMVREYGALEPEQQCAILLAQPELLQRPIISYQGRAVIGRSPESIQALLK